MQNQIIQNLNETSISLRKHNSYKILKYNLHESIVIKITKPQFSHYKRRANTKTIQSRFSKPQKRQKEKEKKNKKGQ